MTLSTESVERGSVGKAVDGFSVLIVGMTAVYRAKGKKVNAAVGLYWDLLPAQTTALENPSYGGVAPSAMNKSELAESYTPTGV